MHKVDVLALPLLLLLLQVPLLHLGGSGVQVAGSGHVEDPVVGDGKEEAPYERKHDGQDRVAALRRAEQEGALQKTVNG